MTGLASHATLSLFEGALRSWIATLARWKARKAPSLAAGTWQQFSRNDAVLPMLGLLIDIKARSITEQ